MTDEIMGMSELVSKTFRNIRAEDVSNANSVLNVWQSVLVKIRSNRNPMEGQNLAEHTRVKDLKNGVLFVESDHPGWTQLLKMYEKFILTGMQKALPQLDISAMAISLRGKGSNDFGIEETSPEKVRSQVQQRIEREEKLLSSFEKSRNSVEEKKSVESQKEFPPELAVIFEDLRSSMLTNSKE